MLATTNNSQSGTSPWHLHASVVASGRRMIGPDVLRSLAIVLVMLVHLPLNTTPGALVTIRQYGWLGVDIFFVLSSYLIGTQRGQIWAPTTLLPGNADLGDKESCDEWIETMAIMYGDPNREDHQVLMQEGEAMYNGRGKDRGVNVRFMAVGSHDLFEPEFCNPASGWEKRENVQNARHRLWQPVPSFPTPESLIDMQLFARGYA